MEKQGGAEASNPDGPWPECVGMAGEECKKLIEKQAPDLVGNIHVLGADSMVTMDYRTDRVWIWTDDNGVVNKPPMRG